MAPPRVRTAEERAFQVHLGVQIRFARWVVGLNQKQFAVRIGRPQPWVSRVERGVQATSTYETGRIALALGVPPSMLLDEPQRFLRRNAEAREEFESYRKQLLESLSGRDGGVQERTHDDRHNPAASNSGQNGARTPSGGPHFSSGLRRDDS